MKKERRSSITSPRPEKRDANTNYVTDCNEGPFPPRGDVRVLFIERILSSCYKHGSSVHRDAQRRKPTRRDDASS